MAGFYLVRVPGIVRVNFRDTYPHYTGPPTVPCYCTGHTMSPSDVSGVEWVKKHSSNQCVLLLFLALVEIGRAGGGRGGEGEGGHI